MGNPLKRKQIRRIESDKKFESAKQELPNGLVFLEAKEEVKVEPVVVEVIKEEVKKEEIIVEEEKPGKKKKSLQGE